MVSWRESMCGCARIAECETGRWAKSESRRASLSRLSSMQTFEITAEESEVLREVLERELREIDVEVFRTDTHDFKEMLKHRRAILERLLAKLSPIPVL